MTTVSPTPLQRELLTTAIANGTGFAFPDELKGGARIKVLTGLVQRGLIVSAEDWTLTPLAYHLLGIAVPTEEAAEPAALVAPVELQPMVVAPATAAANDESVPAADHAAAPADTQTSSVAGTARPDTKEALVTAMLHRPEGATIEEISAATDWIAHTVRGFFSGTLRKKRGLALTYRVNDAGRRVYFIAKQPAVA